MLLNDWSARDLQAWEYQPLGPFLGKSFATSIGAWVTPLAALEAFRVPAPPQQPAPLPYLREAPWALDLELEVELNGAVVARSNARHLYWTPGADDRPPDRERRDACARATCSAPARSPARSATSAAR